MKLPPAWIGVETGSPTVPAIGYSVTHPASMGVPATTTLPSQVVLGKSSGGAGGVYAHPTKRSKSNEPISWRPAEC